MADQWDLRDNPAPIPKPNPAHTTAIHQPCFLTNNDIPQSPAFAGTFESPSGLQICRRRYDRNYSLQTDSGYGSEQYSSLATSSFQSSGQASFSNITHTGSYDLDHKVDDFHLCIKSPSSPKTFPFLPHLSLSSLFAQSGIDFVHLFTRKKELSHIASLVFSYLTAKDLRIVVQVSPSWRSVIKQNKQLWERAQRYEDRFRGASKENEPSTNGKLGVEQTRSLLGESQNLLSPPVSAAPSFLAQSTPSRFDEAKRTLLTRCDHLLRQCPTCKSPARVDPRNNLGECGDCHNRFCSCCLRPYHDSSPCITISPRKRNVNLINSERSKRNLKRLL